MTLIAVPTREGLIYLPSKSEQKPNGVLVSGLSIYDIDSNIYNISYELSYGYTPISYVAFVAFPQVFMTEVTESLTVGFDTEMAIDGKYISLIPPFLLQFYENEISYKQVQQIPNFGKVNLVYYNDDVLFLVTVPYGVIVYSTKKNKFYKIKIPIQNIGTFLKTSVTMIGNIIYFATASQTNDQAITINIMEVEFTYSDALFKIIYSDTIQLPQNTSILYDISIVGNLKYVVAVLRYQVFQQSTVYSTIYFYVYNTQTSSVSKLTTSPQYNMYINTGTTITTNNTSIYGSYVYTMITNFLNGTIQIFSLNLETGNIESTQVNVTAIFDAFLQGNTLIIIDMSNVGNPVKQGNIYFVPLYYYMYELENSSMFEVQYTEIALEKNTLYISGTVKNVIDGSPCSGCMVEIYNALSALGNQLGVQGQPLATTTTDNNGNFSVQIQFQNSPQDANIVVVVKNTTQNNNTQTNMQTQQTTTTQIKTALIA